MDESFSSSASYPNSPITQRRSSPLPSGGGGGGDNPVSVNGTSFYPKRSRSEDFNSNGEKRHEKKLPNLNEAAASGIAGEASAGGHHGLSSSGGAVAAGNGGGGKSARHKFNANAGTSEAELPRLTGRPSSLAILNIQRRLSSMVTNGKSTLQGPSLKPAPLALVPLETAASA